MTEDKGKLLGILVKEILNGIVLEDVFRFEKGRFFIGDQEIPSNDLVHLRQQADMIRSSTLWKYLKNNLDRVSIDRIANQSRSFDDVHFGKAMLYVLDVLDTSLKHLAAVEIATIPEKKKVEKQNTKS